MKNCPETKKTKIIKSIFRVSVLLFILGLFGQVYFTNSVAIKSTELNELSARKEQLEKELAALEFEDTTLSSITNVEIRAIALGFQKMQEDIIALNPVSTKSATNLIIR